jgi:putative serine protease PepD
VTTWNDTPTFPPTIDHDPCTTWDSGRADAAAPTAPHEHPFTAPGAPAFGAPMPPPTAPPAPGAPRKGNGARVALVAVAVSALVGVGYAGRGLVDPPPAAVTAATPVATADLNNNPSTPLVTGNVDEPVKAVAKALGPSVVVIKTEEGLGSGVVYDRSGLIITNAHVVGTAKEVGVTLNDGRTLDGTVLGADTATDIAVVRVQPDGELPAARLAEAAPEVGDLVVALGSPFGLDQTITSGVVSAVNRPVDSGNGTVVDMVQTDAAINPGNSGGALANRKGEVVGINSMIYSESGSNAGIGFAIPVAKAKSTADRIVSGKSLDKALLGVKSTAAKTGDPGAAVSEVTSGSAADKAGVKSGDVITAVNGSPVKDPTDLAGLIAAREPDEAVTLTIRRGGDTVQVQATLGSTPNQGTAPNAKRGQTPVDPNG